MTPYWCIECGLPAELPPDPQPEDWYCWACAGPVASDGQIAYWNNPAFKARLDARLRQLHDGESVELAEFGPRVKFAIGAVADYLLLEALDRDG